VPTSFFQKGTSINSFWNTNTGIFYRYKAPKKPACREAGSLASLNEYIGNLPLPAGRRRSWEKAQVGKQNGVIRGVQKVKIHFCIMNSSF